VKYLQQSSEEVEALFRDFLIGVTHFFRDPAVFALVEQQIIAKLLENNTSGAPIRIWCTGCSTGEEAYSLAILIFERMELVKKNYAIQLFATDIDSRAIAIARAGIYHSGIAQDISAERLARFFTAEPDGSAYRIHKNIRDMLIFSEHDLIKDPPFSKLDMVSCRNLLIYMSSDLQKKIIALFHYALNPDGFLFLGTSETVGELGILFSSLDRKAKIFQRKEDFQSAKRAALSRILPATRSQDTTPTCEIIDHIGVNTPSLPKLSLRELTEQTLLQCVDPACALVNANGDILYLHGRTGKFLEPSPGEASINNILKMAREGLRRTLTTALHKAATKKAPIRV
jgi:two-component system CheB/CheR fusion protein